LLGAVAPLAQTPSGPQPGPTATIILQDDFERGTLDRWEQVPNTGRYGVSMDRRRVKSGTHSLQVRYTTTNSYGVLTHWFMPGFEELYVKFSVMFEDGFVNPGMHFFVLAGNRTDNRSSATARAGVKPNGRDFFYAGLDPEYDPRDPTLRPFHFYTYWPDMSCCSDMSCCYGNRFYQTSPKRPLIGGDWHEVVVHIKLNTPGESDGSQTLWIDGEKKIDVQNLRWRTTMDLRLNQIRFDNWMAAGPKTESIWVDDVTVWRP
jgi:hypothetical protein